MIRCGINTKIPSISFQDDDSLFHGKIVIDTEGAIAITLHDTVLRCPSHTRSIPCPGLHISETRSGISTLIDVCQSAKDRDKHASGHGHMGRKFIARDALKQAVFIDKLNGLARTTAQRQNIDKGNFADTGGDFGILGIFGIHRIFVIRAARAFRIGGFFRILGIFRVFNLAVFGSAGTLNLATDGLGAVTGGGVMRVLATGIIATGAVLVLSNGATTSRSSLVAHSAVSTAGFVCTNGGGVAGCCLLVVVGVKAC